MGISQYDESNRRILLVDDNQSVHDAYHQILSQKDRYRTVCEALLTIKGVGLKTAMTFITEIGDMARFSNRRQVGAYIGLVPSTYESGENDDRK